MNYYKDNQNNVFAYSDIQTPEAGLIKITEQEALELTNPPPSQYHKLNAENEWVPDTAKKQALITAIRANIDADTDAKIINDFKLEGKGFKLSLENQMNYKAEHELREVLTYPHKVRCIEGYHHFQDAAEYHLFYLSAVAFIRSTIENGWNQKDALESKTTAELITIITG